MTLYRNIVLRDIYACGEDRWSMCLNIMIYAHKCTNNMRLYYH